VAQTGRGLDLAEQTVARLCCGAVFRRVVLDGSGVPIDVGRAQRTPSTPSGRPCAPSMPPVPGPAAAARSTTARSITSGKGNEAARPTWPTWSRCVPSTITGSTRAAGASGSNPIAGWSSPGPTAPTTPPPSRRPPPTARSDAGHPRDRADRSDGVEPSPKTVETCPKTLVDRRRSADPEGRSIADPGRSP
jgi:hypothetical protein